MIAKHPDGQPDAISSDAPAQAQITADCDVVAAIWERYEAIRLWAYPERESRRIIEVAMNLPGMIAVRDSKDPAGPKLLFTRDEWKAFIGGVMNGEFDIRA